MNFMANRETNYEPETIIAAGVQVEGDFTSQGNVLIEGIVQGSLKTERDLRVGEKAVITANVKAANAVVAGEVRGNVVVSGKLELEQTARVYGDVKTEVLVVAAGAMVNGNIRMGNEEASTPDAKTVARGVRGRAVKTTEEAAAAEAPAAEAVEEKKTVNAFFR